MRYALLALVMLAGLAVASHSPRAQPSATPCSVAECVGGTCESDLDCPPEVCKCTDDGRCMSAELP